MKIKHMTLDQVLDKLVELENRIEQLEKRPKAGRPPERIAAALEWLGKLLKKGPVAITYVFREGRKEGFSNSLIRKAGRELLIESDRKTWRLPGKYEEGPVVIKKEKRK